MSTAIEFNNISKQYKLGLVSTKTLSHDLNRWWQTKILHNEDPYLKIGSVNDRSSKADSDYVWALKGIDFKVEQGDVLGIIGKNGAGKSTLLKLLSKVTSPTVGTIKARGRIGSLLEVGTGFHPEMTGRENIFMNGAILGMNKREIQSKLDEIVDFSGCERYIDTPVKRYSSGMTVRLGFAVAAHLDPEILVVDEVLAVGDAEFQKKAIGKMQDVSKGEGRTVLFVSHNMASVQSLCTRGVVLGNGMIKYIGPVEKAISVYRSSCMDDTEYGVDLNTEDRCHKETRFVDFTLLDKAGRPCNHFTFGDKLRFRFKIFSRETVTLAVRVTVFDSNEVRTIAIDSADEGVFIPIRAEEEILYECESEQTLNIKPGRYRVNVSLRYGQSVLDHVINVQGFDILDEDFYGFGRYHISDMALFLTRHKWRNINE